MNPWIVLTLALFILLGLPIWLRQARKKREKESLLPPDRLRAVEASRCDWVILVHSAPGDHWRHPMFSVLRFEEEIICRSNQVDRTVSRLARMAAEGTLVYRDGWVLAEIVLLRLNKDGTRDMDAPGASVSPVYATKVYIGPVWSGCVSPGPGYWEHVHLTDAQYPPYTEEEMQVIQQQLAAHRAALNLKASDHA